MPGTREVPGTGPELNSQAHLLHRTAGRTSVRLCCGREGRQEGDTRCGSPDMMHKGCGEPGRALEVTLEQLPALHRSTASWCLPEKAAGVQGVMGRPPGHFLLWGFGFRFYLSRPGKLYFLLAILLFLVASMS